MRGKRQKERVKRREGTREKREYVPCQTNRRTNLLKGAKREANGERA